MRGRFFGGWWDLLWAFVCLALGTAYLLVESKWHVLFGIAWLAMGLVGTGLFARARMRRRGGIR